MKCRLASLALSLLAQLLVFDSAHAFVTVRSTTSGADLHWNAGSTLTFRTNTTNRSGLSERDLLSIFTTSLSRWKQAALDGFFFNYYQGTDTSRYPNYTGSPYDNSIFFTSNGSTTDRLSCGIVALTQVWFDPSNGAAQKADVRFNDNCYTFTTNPADTTSQSRIFLTDVATHEFGHALGLDHSQSMQSSMMYTAAIEMANPSCDDQAAMRSLYAGNAGAGSISGSVVTAGGAAVFGAHVQAISLDRGVTIATTLSQSNGSFTLTGLEPGTYGLLVEPYYPGASTLSPYYASINAGVCSGGALFQRTFLTSGGSLTGVTVGSGSNISVGQVAVKCTAPGSLNSNQENSFASAPVLAATDVAQPVATQGIIGTTGGATSSDHYFRLLAQSGRLVIHALSHTLFSRADVQVEVLDSFGTRLAQTSFGDVFATSSGYVNYDAETQVQLTGIQDVYVHVYTRSQLTSSKFPAGSTGVSSVPYYVLTISRGPAPGAFLAANARCQSPDLFSAYSSIGEAPGFSAQEEDSGSSGCGTIRDMSGDDDGPMGPGSLIRMGNFFLMAAMLMVLRRRLLAQGLSA